MLDTRPPCDSLADPECGQDTEDNGVVEGERPKLRPRRASEGDNLRQKSSPSKHFEPVNGSQPHAQSRNRLKRPVSDPPPPKGKGRQLPNGNGPYSPPYALTEWPPSGCASDEELNLGHAMELICRGVPAHRGVKRPIPHLADQFFSTYATTAGNRGDGNDGVNQHDSMTQLMTMRLQGPGPATYPWESIEQPSFSFHFGQRPGTVTLNHWASTASAYPPALNIRDSGVQPREVDLVRIFGRLRDLEGGLEDDDLEYMYKNLYRKLLKDPDRMLNPHKGLEKQITDLILVLSRPDHWIDFSNPKNHIITRFIFDTGHANHDQYVKFFHQLLLSMELDLRIHSKQHSEWAKEKLLEQLPPTIRWNLALSRRWRNNVRIEAYGNTADQGMGVSIWARSLTHTNPLLSQVALQTQAAAGQDDQAFRANDEVAQPCRDTRSTEARRPGRKPRCRQLPCHGLLQRPGAPRGKRLRSFSGI